MEKQQKKKEAKLTRALEPHKDFGKTIQMLNVQIVEQELKTLNTGIS